MDRAGQIRQYAAESINASSSDSHERASEDQNSDLSSGEEEYEEMDSDDVDSDGLEDDMMLRHEDTSLLSQQENFVRF